MSTSKSPNNSWKAEQCIRQKIEIKPTKTRMLVKTFCGINIMNTIIIPDNSWKAEESISRKLKTNSRFMLTHY